MPDNRRRKRRKPVGEPGASERFGKKASGSWIELRCRVIRLLPDDREGEAHQRMIVDAGENHTLLIAHNLDIAERVPASLGDRIFVRGLFEWNDLGGLLHWTHRDPMGFEEGGYIEHSRTRYA